MTVFDRVQHAKNPQEALAAVAHGIDHITSRLDKIDKFLANLPEAEDDGWNWKPSPVEPENVQSDTALDAELRAAAVERVRVLEAKRDDTPEGHDRDAVDAALRLARDDLTNLQHVEDAPEPRASKVEIVDGEVIVNLPKPSTDKLKRRLAFAKSIDIESGLGIPDAAEVYARGGPLWLYYGNREYVMQLPVELRREMVEDVAEDDASEAQLMGRDVLKDDDPRAPALDTD